MKEDSPSFHGEADAAQLAGHRAIRMAADVLDGLAFSGHPDSPGIARRLGVISFGLKGVPHNLAAEVLAERSGIGVRTGCFCAPILVKRLLRMNPVRETAFLDYICNI